MAVLFTVAMLFMYTETLPFGNSIDRLAKINKHGMKFMSRPGRLHK